MAEENHIEDRMEILFLYETKDCNPNGDPLDENKPRMDPETNQVTVTDVRIKRTIRDYLNKTRGEEILVRDTFDNAGYLKDGKGRCEDFYAAAGVEKDDSITTMVAKVQKAIVDSCIDARLFGSTLPVEFGKKKSSIKLTGPVQFNGFNRSLHQVSPIFVQGTAGFASEKNATQKSFREDYILPYACIAAYGVINEITARESRLTERDVDLLLEGLWLGTESLITRSKIGHQPLFLMRLRYRDGRRLGNLTEALKLQFVQDFMEEIKIRSASDYVIDCTQLVDLITSKLTIVKAIDIYQDSKLKFTDGQAIERFQALPSVKSFPIRELSWEQDAHVNI